MSNSDREIFLRMLECDKNKRQRHSDKLWEFSKRRPQTCLNMHGFFASCLSLFYQVYFARFCSIYELFCYSMLLCRHWLTTSKFKRELETFCSLLAFGLQPGEVAKTLFSRTKNFSTDCIYLVESIKYLWLLKKCLKPLCKL